MNALTNYTEPSFNNPELAQFVDAILARQRELRSEGIDEREIDRVLVAEFSSGQNYIDTWGPTNNNPTEPALTDGQATTKYPPEVLPQELDLAGPFDNDGFDHRNPDPGYAGGRDVHDLDQYKTNAPENKVEKSSSLVPDEVLHALGSKTDSQPPTLGITGYNSDMAIPPWRYDVEQDQGGVSEIEEGGPGSGCKGPNCGRKPGGTSEEWTQGMLSRGVTPDEVETNLIKADELTENGGQINNDGTVKLYHYTNPVSKQQIKDSGKMVGLENGVFFSTKKGGEATGFGSEVVSVDVPLEHLEIDDLFGDEAHVRIPTLGPGVAVDISDYNLGETVTIDTSLPELLDKDREEYLQKDNEGVVDMPHMVVDGPEIPDEPHMVVAEAVEPVWGKYHLGPAHPHSDICDKYKMKVYDLNDEARRPIPPSEGLGYTNTHPNCQCYWQIVKRPKKTTKVTKPQLKHIQHINRIIGQKSRYGSLHKVHADGKIYKTMTDFNPRLRETIMEIREEFSWLTPSYLDRIKAVNAPGQMFLVRASAEAITDHRGEGEPLRRWLSPDELHGMARTATGKTMDINHRPDLETKAQVLDSEFNRERNEIQMIINEQDPEIVEAINRGDITAVSINGGSPRNETVQCPDCHGPNCECFIVPEGVILGELDGIALTWVVTNPNGIMFRGQMIPPASPGVKTTAIEPL